MAKSEPVLRKSLFIGVPPFINFVPGGGFPGEVIRGPQYWDHDNWDQDQLWRVALAMARWIEVRKKELLGIISTELVLLNGISCLASGH